MEIINVSKGTTLAQNILIADTPLKRIIGLIGRKQLAKDEALIIRSCNSIHTLFMGFPIDVLFVSSKNKIIFLKTHLQPWQVTPIFWQAEFVIELPAGAVQNSNTSLGDEIRFE
jgi:hypothetical protein